MQSRTDTQITITQSAVRNDGQIIGANIGQLDAAGDVTIQSYLLERPAVELDPPPAMTMRAYLTAAANLKEQGDPSAVESKEQQIIRDLGFNAHRPGDEQPQDLYEIFNTITLGNREHGGFQRVVLLADSWMGKTTALKYVLRKRAQASLAYSESLKDGEAEVPADCVIPLLVRLEYFDSNHPIIDLICDSFNALLPTGGDVDRITINQTHGLLEKYPCLLLFDNLGELVSRRVMGGFLVVNRFMEIYQEHQYLISCSTSWYRENLGSLDKLFLDNLEKEKVEAIIGKETYAKLDPVSQELARNRGMLLEYLRMGKSSEMLRTKGWLLKLQISQKIDQYYLPIKDGGVERPCSREILEGILEELAFGMRRNHTHSYSDLQMMDMTVTFLQNWKEAVHWRKLAHEMEDTELGLAFLVHDPERRQWRFRDISIEAYFASTAVLHNPKLLSILLDQVDDYWWRDVFEILVGLYPEPKNLLFDLIDRNVFVAANSIRFVPQAGVEDALIDALDERMKFETAPRRKYIVERIGESDLDCAAEAVIKVIHREWSSMVMVAAVKAVIGWEKRTGKPIEEAERRVLHSLPGSAGSIMDVLKHYPSADDPGNVDQLVATLQDPTCPSKIQGLAAIGLGLMDPKAGRYIEVMKILFDAMACDQVDDFVAWCSVESLTQTNARGVYLRALHLLKNKEIEPVIYSHCRARAVYLLGWMRRGVNSDRLLRKALKDCNPFVRGYAIDAMARLDLLDAREQIEDILQKEEEEPFVHRKAAEALGQIGTIASIQVLERSLYRGKARTRWAVRQAIEEIKQRNAL
jgi:hypothetical protein